VTELQAGRSGVQIPAGARDCYHLQSVQTDSGTHPAFRLVRVAFFLGAGGSWGMRLTSPFHLVPRVCA